MFRATFVVVELTHGQALRTVEPIVRRLDTASKGEQTWVLRPAGT